MNIGTLHFRSRALGRRVTFGFGLPEPGGAESGPYPALLQLHGAGGDHSDWFTLSRLPTFLEGLPIVVVAPDGASSHWMNYGPRERYEDFLIEDLMPACESFFPIHPGRWGIGGNSMGGYGALRLGLKYPSRFASVYAHSPGVFDRGFLDEYATDLTPEQRDDADVFAHATRTAALPSRPVLSFDCGLDDQLLPRIRAFHEHLHSIDLPHRYSELAGGHTWEFWNSRIPNAVHQHIDVLSAHR